jgi:hypothetical protein
VSNDRIPLMAGIAFLLALGSLVAWLLPRVGQPVGLGLGETLWRARRADLAIQLGLVFVGALGIRALLPPEDEEDEE